MATPRTSRFERVDSASVGPCVYLLRTSRTGRDGTIQCKVGQTCDLKRRLRELRTEHFWRILGAIPCEDRAGARILERELIGDFHQEGFGLGGFTREIFWIPGHVVRELVATE